MSKFALDKIIDVKFYLENLTKIKGKKPGSLIRFILNEAQKDLFNAVRAFDRVMILKARQLGFCFDPKTKVLTADLSWIEIDNLKVGDKIIATDEKVLGGSGSSRKMRTAVVQNKWDVSEEALKLTMDDGRTLILTSEHRMLCKARRAVHTEWRKAKNIRLNDEIRYITKLWEYNPSYEDGWIGGILDGEGSVNIKKTGVDVVISQVDGFVWDRILKYFGDNNYLYRIEVDKRIARSSSKLGSKPVNKLVISRMDEIFRLLGTVKPSRFCKKFWWEGKKFPYNGWSRVAKIELLPKQRMIDLQTSTKTFIANGFVSHNSTAMVGYFYHNTITNPGTTTALIGYNSDLTAELLDKVKTFYRSTPNALKPTIQYNSKYEISFPVIDSKILVLPSTQNVGRGYTLTNCLCLSGKSVIYKRNGIPFEIKNLKKGDEILNGAGSYSKVKDVVSKNNKEELIKLSVYGCDPLSLTRDHQLFVRGNGVNGEWKRAGDITKKDYVAFPYFQNRNKIKEITLKKYVKDKYESRGFKLEKIKLTRELGELCGWFVSEGSFSENQVVLSLHKKEVRYILNLLKNNFSEYFSSWNVSYSKNSDTALVHLYGKPLCCWLAEMFGERCQNKKIDDRVWRWGWDFSYGLLRGIILGDGCLKNKRRTIIVTTIPSLAYQLKRLLVSTRICLPSIRHCKSYRYGNEGLDRYDIHIGGKGNYKLRRKLNFELPVYNNGRARWTTKNVPGTNQGGGYWIRGKFNYWGKVRKIETVTGEPLVYDILLEKNPHSFVANGMVVHNCTELSSWEKAEEKMMTLEASVPIGGKLVIESCVTGDTIILTNNGPMKIEDVHSWEKNTLGFSEGEEILIDGHYGLKPTSTYYNSGIQKGFRIKTKHGYELGMSSVHKIFVLRNGKIEFVKAKDMKKGDLLTIKYGQELWGNNDTVNWKPSPYPGFNKQNIKLFSPEKITPDLAYLIGVILGDGYVSKKYNKVVVANIDEDLTDFLLNTPLGLKFNQGKKDDYYHYICSNRSFIEFLQEYVGFKEGVKAHRKEIPDIVFGWSRANVVSFLQGLFDADGSCRKDRGEVSFTSTSKQIVDTVRSLLLNFGIISRTYSYNAKPSKKVKVWSSGHKIEISRSHSNIFLDKIGFRIKRKQANRNEQKIEYSCLQEFVPGIGKILKKKMRVLGLKYSDVSNGMNKCFFSKSGDVTYLTLGRILEKCRNKNSDEYIKIKELYDNRYFYDEIDKIFPIEENVYDFTVDDGHTVTYSGFVGHQTPRGQGNLYHRMWMLDNDYVKKEYGWWWGYCLDDETEILTVNGWKKRKEFNIGDKHFTVNLKTKKLEIKEATDKIDYKFNGKMVHFESQNIDMMVTPNHRCIIQSSASYQSDEKKWILKQAKDVNKLDYIPLSTLGWSENKVKKYNDEFVELIGWVITEASFERYLIYIYQNIGENLDRIESLCKTLGYKYTRYIRKDRPCGEIRIHSSSTKKIRGLLGEKSKSLPMKFLLELTYDQLILLQRTMVMADGYVDGGIKKTLELCDRKCSFVQKNKHVSNNFQTLTTLIGNCSRIQQNNTTDKCYVIRVKQGKVAQKFSKKYEEYNGHVWCPTNENGTIVVRRNGKVMITGQSREEIEIIKRRMNNPSKFAQEYGLEFLASGRAVFDAYVIRRQRKNVLKVGDIFIDRNGERNIVVEEDRLRIYARPKAETSYVCGVDVSEGVEGGDYSCAVIWDRETGEEVAFFKGLVPPDRLADFINKWGRTYNKALMVVEINNHGLTTLTKLKQLAYPSLYFRPKKIDSLSESIGDKFGWRTTKLTRPLLIDQLAQACRDNELVIHSKEILDEMSVFIYNDNGDMVTQSGFHDDCLKKGTLIKTDNGYKEIEKIVPGNMVLTHKGRFCEVEKCLKKPFDGDWYDIDINGRLNLELSYNHPVYVATGKYKGSNLINYSKRQWKLPHEITKSYKPISIIEKLNKNKDKKIFGYDNKWGGNKDNFKKIVIVLGKEFAKFLGIFLAEGCCSRDNNQMSLAFSQNEISLCDEMERYLKGLGLHVRKELRKDMHCLVLHFVSKTLSELLKQCYDDNREKQLPSFAYSLGEDLKYVLEYWLIGDGWVDCQTSYDKIGATTSKKLGLQMMDIAWSSGFYATVHKVRRCRYGIVNKDQYYVNVKYSRNKNQHLEKLSSFEYAGKTRQIIKNKYKGYVYNLQVKDDNSFIADGTVVHNCLFASGISYQGFKLMASRKPSQLNYEDHLPKSFSY